MTSPKPKHRRPTKEEMEERLVVPLDPDELVEGILQVKPDDGDEASGNSPKED
jgi:hypothetical protein